MSNEIITPTTIRAEATRILGRCRVNRDITPEAEFAAARAHNETRSLQDLGIIAASKTIYDGHCMVSNLDYAKNAFVFSWADGEVDCLDYPLGTYPFQSAPIKILRRKGENIRDEVTIITTPGDTPQYWLGHLGRHGSRVSAIPVQLPDSASGKDKMCWVHLLTAINQAGVCMAEWPDDRNWAYAMPQASRLSIVSGRRRQNSAQAYFLNFMVLGYGNEWHIFCHAHLALINVPKFEGVVIKFMKTSECKGLC